MFRGCVETSTEPSFTDTVIPVPLVPSTLVGPGEPGAPRAAYGSAPDSIYRGRLPDTEVQLIPLGRPNNQQDGWPGTLSLALNASKTRIAYTRLEPVNAYYKARIVAVEEAPSGEWWIHQFLLADDRYEGWPMADYQDAAAFAIRQLAVPDGPVWWAASGLLSVVYEIGLCYPDLRDLKAAINAVVFESLSPEHQRIIQEMVKRLHDVGGLSYSGIYADFNGALRVKKYTQLPDAAWPMAEAWFTARIKAAERRDG